VLVRAAQFINGGWVGYTGTDTRGLLGSATGGASWSVTSGVVPSGTYTIVAQLTQVAGAGTYNSSDFSTSVTVTV
jgi:hypothetical protein